MPEEDPDLLAGDNLDGLRGRNPYSPMSERFRLTELLENARYENNLLVQKCRELQERIDAIKHQVEAKENINSTLTGAFNALRRERDEARREACGSDGGTIGEAMLDAEQRGWDCFKEKGWVKIG